MAAMLIMNVTGMIMMFVTVMRMAVMMIVMGDARV